ncbi:hypothetical protein AHAS_Ahas02G0104900 [Arachis hypogaea]
MQDKAAAAQDASASVAQDAALTLGATISDTYTPYKSRNQKDTIEVGPGNLKLIYSEKKAKLTEYINSKSKLENEITRLSAVKAFAVIAAFPLRVDLLCSGASLALELCYMLMSDKRSSPSVGHLFIEVFLLVVILFLLSQKSYKPPKRPLTNKKIDELCDEWVPEPLIPSLNEELYAPPVLER